MSISTLEPPTAKSSRQASLHNACFFHAGERPLEAVLKQPHRLFFETEAHEGMSTSILRILSDMPDFALSLSTLSAYKSDVALAVTDCFCARFGLQARAYTNIITCLQEAIVNAIVHGNLGIDGQFKTQEEFDRYYALIEERLAQEQFRNRRISVLAWSKDRCMKVCVVNEGNEFPMTSAMISEQAPHGRGLFFIQSLTDKVWIGEDRCSLYMTFAR